MPLSPDEREWVRQQALQQATEAEAKKRMAKAEYPITGGIVRFDLMAPVPRLDIIYGTGTIRPLPTPSDLIADHDRKFLALLKIQADF